MRISTIVICTNRQRFESQIPRFHFDIHENGRFIPDEDGCDFEDAARKEALLTGASIARDVFITGSTNHVAVREDGTPCMRISFALEVDRGEAASRIRGFGLNPASEWRAGP